MNGCMDASWYGIGRLVMLLSALQICGGILLLFVITKDLLVYNKEKLYGLDYGTTGVGPTLTLAFLYILTVFYSLETRAKIGLV
jgi:hypothetical protein